MYQLALNLSLLNKEVKSIPGIMMHNLHLTHDSGVLVGFLEENKSVALILQGSVHSPECW